MPGNVVLAWNVKILCRKKHRRGAKKSKFTQLLSGWSGVERRNVWHLCHLTKHMSRRHSNAHSSLSAESPRCGWTPNLCEKIGSHGFEMREKEEKDPWDPWQSGPSYADASFHCQQPILLGALKAEKSRGPWTGMRKDKCVQLTPITLKTRAFQYKRSLKLGP